MNAIEYSFYYLAMHFLFNMKKDYIAIILNGDHGDNLLMLHMNTKSAFNRYAT